MNSIEELVSKISDASDEVFLGAKGWLGIKRVPHIGSHAYLHVLFLPPERDVSTSVLLRSGLTIPDYVKNFLEIVNGAILFQGGLSLYGIRTSFVRDVDNRQPFDIIEINSVARPREAAPGDFYIGGSSADGSRLLIKGQGPVVYRCERGTGRMLEEWASIEEMLNAEILRLAAAYEETKGS